MAERMPRTILHDIGQDASGTNPALGEVLVLERTARSSRPEQLF